ncbi:1-(5-phosphoribosyl)-5-((5-phosphoribosylamino)methylideneamino)imidazole-4-carboxamide isomerase [Mycolicibacterium helvum]|uniref:4-hydroxythreonine-4-phosphate dehydrogenase n=1 Tax=Mycolicibacterium helvum TaxID=1534349 RepID=A0A7I7SZ39_9MYCO|nr:1-(5-phosphoribosyl)-5-((5-phosphoribosylamino)methylideneamino)imidazole-4-carboxamide isomerase [Mycolicibacterium helvum]BBY62068.1 4-hydroxythreonine-4-phosphate dehydrogenase [Mycolicibacterium helvum]
MAEFIFMLTHNDRTVDHALDALHVALKVGVRHVGFKDVGSTPERQVELVSTAREAGVTTYLEVVAETRDAELAAVSAGITAGVDWILGGKAATDVVDMLRGRNIRYAPFCGRTVGHPSVLEGTVDEIASDAATLTAIDGVDGVDLLAYRHRTADIGSLISSTVSRSAGPVIVAGSVTSAEQVRTIADAGAWGFTIGGAVFSNELDARPGLESQLTTALQYASDTQQDY